MEKKVSFWLAARDLVPFVVGENLNFKFNFETREKKIITVRNGWVRKRRGWKN
jgi:hypothetical protein